MKRTILIAACLLAATTCAASGLFGGPPEPGQMPSRFVRFDGYDAGMVLWCALPKRYGVDYQFWFRLAKVTVILDRVRFGAAIHDTYAELEGWSGDMMLPLHVGYTFFSRPEKTQFFYGVVPDIYAEVSGSFVFAPAIRAAVCCDVDYGGVGARFEMGWADIKRRYDATRTSRTSFLYAGLQLRILTFGIGF